MLSAGQSGRIWSKGLENTKTTENFWRNDDDLFNVIGCWFERGGLSRGPATIALILQENSSNSSRTTRRGFGNLVGSAFFLNNETWFSGPLQSTVSRVHFCAQIRGTRYSNKSKFLSKMKLLWSRTKKKREISVQNEASVKSSKKTCRKIFARMCLFQGKLKIFIAAWWIKIWRSFFVWKGFWDILYTNLILACSKWINDKYWYS